MAWLVQLFSGMFAGGVIGLLFQFGSENMIVAIAVGSFLGWLAPFWVKHIPLP